MKKDIHPKVNTDTTVVCACGNTFVTTSTLKSISVEICSNCHPFYTGTQRIVDTEGRVDRFKKQVEAKTTFTPSTKKNKSAKAGATVENATPTLKDLLNQARQKPKN